MDDLPVQYKEDGWHHYYHELLDEVVGLLGVDLAEAGLEVLGGELLEVSVDVLTVAGCGTVEVDNQALRCFGGVEEILDGRGRGEVGRGGGV